MLFFQIKFHLELTHPSNSHGFPWFILTWEEGRIKKGELWFCLIYQIYLGTLVDFEGLVLFLQEEKIQPRISMRQQVAVRVGQICDPSVSSFV